MLPATNATDASRARRIALGTCAAATIGMAVTLSLPGYQPFAARPGSMLSLHLVLELFAVVVSVLVVTFSWHALGEARDRTANVLVVGFSVVAVCDLLHALTYEGMPGLLAESSTPRAIFFWLMGRSAETLTMWLVALRAAPDLGRGASAGLAAILAAAIAWIGHWRLGAFPDTFVEGVGVTPFKAYFEYILCVSNVLVAALFWRRARSTDVAGDYLLAAACFITGLGEIVFAGYQSPQDFANIFGHVFKVAAYAFIFRAAVLAGIQAPYERVRESERRVIESEAEVRRLNEALEARVGERTAALEEANRELESFSYSIAHDLRAPLRAIVSYSALIDKEVVGRLSPEAASHLGRVRARADQMARLIEGLLALAKSGRQPILKEPVDVERMVGDCIEDLAPERVGRDIRFEVGDLPACQADRVLLRQVLANLIGNAVKYTRDRSPAIIEIGSSIQGGEVVLHVRDNGIGFDMREADKLFGVFQRLHTEGEFEGTGIGLAIVQRIVLRHGGRIWAEAAPGKGATFHLALPA